MCGRAQLEVSEELGIAQSVISRLWHSFQDDGKTCLINCLPPLVRQIGLYARRPVKFVPLTATHCRLRFSLQSDSLRTFIWCVSGTRTTKRTSLNDTVSVVQDCSFREGGIILGSRSDHGIQNRSEQIGAMTGQIYRDVILGQHVRLFRGAMGAKCVFRDDNAHLHRTNIVSECLQSEDITRMNWSAFLPDLNPV
ncbi:transposable element Tcb1 transposase [Trichonephila clavipes]|nr:transposable element Tcb1 transposase [Trichonephila clavipes]